jgi:2-methylisocitrate lyase-like PEP mutase family enzyme
VADQADKARRFRELHRPGAPLLLPNPWDAGSARLLASLGFEALATTSSGFAATLGRLDGSVTRDEAIGHAAQVVAATELPVSADLEDCFAAEPGGVAATLRAALDAGLAGCSIEDHDRSEILDIAVATERVASAAEVAHARSVPFVLTARAENHLHGGELADTIARLRAYQDAGADVLYAPGLRTLEEIGAVLAAIDRPLNVLALPGMPAVAELASAGVARISVGGGFAFVAIGAVVEAARELREEGTYGYWPRARMGVDAAKAAFG